MSGRSSRLRCHSLCTWLHGLYGKLRGLNDSKQLAEEQGEYFGVLTSRSEIGYAIGIVDSGQSIRSIFCSAHRAMSLALEQLNLSRSTYWWTVDR